MSELADPHRLGFVVIGRNEGERLRHCLASIPPNTTVVYVDSGSTDGSLEWARAHGTAVVALDMATPFTAARARNAGFRRLMQAAPNLIYVQFVDGDCELAPGWPGRAACYLDAQPQVCAVFGRRRERDPEQSIYNFLCDLEWDGPIGENKAFGGDVMLRSSALQAAGGYREDLIAGEEPELSVRLRAGGWTIVRIDAEMTLHDAAMTRFAQWWRRYQRSGFAFAEGAALHGGAPERHWVWEARRAVLWGLAAPLACATLTLASMPFGGWGALSWLIFPAQALRLFLRGGHRPASERGVIALFQVLGRFPEAQGWLKYWSSRLKGRKPVLIEYKTR